MQAPHGYFEGLAEPIRSITNATPRREACPGSCGFLRCSLDSRADFCFDRNVPVDEDYASESRTAPSAPKASIAFTTTHWSVVLEAQGQSPAAQEALEKLCRTYWRPVCGFIRRQGNKTEEAEDLTQGFF